MTNLTPENIFSSVRQLERTDPATAATFNTQAQQLLNRTEFLKNESETKATTTYVDQKVVAVSGGYFKSYATLALANADIANIPLNVSVRVLEEINGGDYYKQNSGSSTLTKSEYDPLTQSKTYTDIQTANFRDGLIQQLKNLYNPAKKQVGKYVSNTGVIETATGWSCSDYISVTVGQTYAISAISRRTGVAFYDSSKVFIAGSYSSTLGNYIISAPANSAYVVINIDSNVVNSSNVQIEEGSVFTSYEPYSEQVKASMIPNIMALAGIEGIKAMIDKEYEINIVSPNIYDSSSKQLNKLVDSVNGRITSATGWSCSDFIPVVAGQTYTISFTTKRVGLAWYTSVFQSQTGAIAHDNNSVNPMTVTAPAGANYLVINVDSTTVTGSNVQVESGAVATTYQTYGTKKKINADYINFGVLESPKNALTINGNSATVLGIVDNIPISLNLLLTKANTHDQSTVFNFASDIVNNVIQRAVLNDDVAPMRIDNYTIGANHGYEKSNVTLANHGKTTVDIGSVWSSVGKQYVIVDIVSTSVLSVTCRSDNTPFAIGVLTHVSGATNTAAFTPTATTSRQWYPAIRDRKLTCFVDNIKIDLTQDATHNFKNTVKFLESYSIMKKTDIVEWLIINKGINHVNYNAVPCYTVNFDYTFDHELGCTIYFSGVGRKTVALQDQMIVHSIQLDTGNGTVYNYIPKSVEFAAGGFTYNFSQLEDIRAKNPSSSLYLTSARQESSVNPVDRLVMLNDQVGYAIGYLPVFDAAPDVRVDNASNRYLEIRNSSLKIYPRLIDSASITQINEDDAFAAIAYRKYFKRSVDRTCKYVVRSELGDYLYLDWHSAKTDEIELPPDLIGRSFELHEKSSNVTLLSKFASHSILVKVDSTKSYGYLVLKFNK